MRILGLSAYYHDAAAALICDGRVVAAAEQERFSRRKHDADFPLEAARFCLARGGLEADQLDASVLQQLRTLAESSPTTEPWMSIVLSGLFGLLDKLSAPDLFPLKRRISLRCTLSGLRRDELDAFIAHRFGSRDAQRIADDVRDDLFERTQAAPAVIDQILRHALAQAQPTINSEVLHAILDNHGL